MIDHSPVSKTRWDGGWAWGGQAASVFSSREAPNQESCQLPGAPETGQGPGLLSQTGFREDGRERMELLQQPLSAWTSPT